MRKFTTIFVAVVLCIAALSVVAFAAATDCTKGEHDWGAWKLVKIEANGDKVYESTCACGVKNPEKKVEHTHSEEKLAAVAATCTEAGLTEGKKCKTCGEITVAQKEIAALGHTEEAIAAVAAACGKTGLTEGKKCTVCGEITVAQEEIPAIAHTEEVLAAVAATCDKAGLTEGKKCSVCGEIIVAQEEVAPKHTVAYVAAVAPTATENGNVEYWNCAACGKAWSDAECTKEIALDSVVIPATGETTEPTAPDTGDNAIFFAVALVAVAVAGVAVVSFKKREN